MIKASIPWNCKQIHKMVMNNSLIFDNAIQRGFVWDKKRSSLFIDSILRDYITPPMYTIKDGRTVKTPKGDVAVFDCLDGKQRCQTITRFKNNEFVLVLAKGEIVLDDGTTFDLNGKTFEDLPDQLKDDFDKYSMTVYYVTDATTDEIIEIMSRLNNGKPLTNIEISRIKAVDLKGIDELADHKMFKTMFSERALNGYQDEDTVVKTHMLLNALGKDVTKYSLDNADVKPVFETMTLTPSEKQHITKLYDAILAVYLDIIDKKKKKVASYLAKRTHLLSMLPAFDRAISDKKSIDEMSNFVIDFFSGDPAGGPSKNPDYSGASASGSNHSFNVYARTEAVIEEYNNFFK